MKYYDVNLLEKKIEKKEYEKKQKKIFRQKRKVKRGELLIN